MLPSVEKKEDLRKHFHLLEAVAWSHLTSGQHLSQMENFAGLYGAAMTGDSKAVDVILKGLSSTNAHMRYVTLRMVSRYNDKVLQDDILRMTKEEKNWFVRIGLIEAIGEMGLEKGTPFLRDIIESRRSSHDERASAVQSYVRICDKLDYNDVQALLSNKRAPLRELAVALIAHYEEEAHYPSLFNLLEDHSFDVRMKVLVSLASINIDDGIIQKEKKKILTCIEESNPYVSLLASWLLLKVDSERAIEELVKSVKSGNQDRASYAACLLGRGGDRTAMVVQQLLDEEKNPFVRVNLALGMIYQQTNTKRAANVLAEFLKEGHGDLMWKQIGGPSFGVVVESSVRHVPYIPQYPSVVDQMTRLDLLNMLCVVGHESTEELARIYLQKRTWGVSASAAGLMLGEGEMDSIAVIRKLLDDEDPRMRLQAALALAFFGRDSSILPTLLESYEKVDWEKKLHILEALGHIGAREGISFLIDVMKHGTPLFQKVAAGSVIQCLYH